MLGRIFEHPRLKTASERTVARLNREAKGRARGVDAPEPEVARNLRRVAQSFIDAQGARHDADYDTAAEWTPFTVFAQIDTVERAFAAWSAIRETPEAQAFLVSMLAR